MTETERKNRLWARTVVMKKLPTEELQLLPPSARRAYWKDFFDELCPSRHYDETQQELEGEARAQGVNVGDLLR